MSQITHPLVEKKVGDEKSDDRVKTQKRNEESFQVHARKEHTQERKGKEEKEEKFPLCSGVVSVRSEMGQKLDNGTDGRKFMVHSNTTQMHSRMQGQTAEVSSQNQNNKYNKMKESEIMSDRGENMSILEKSQKITNTKPSEMKERESEKTSVQNRKNKNTEKGTTGSSNRSETMTEKISQEKPQDKNTNFHTPEKIPEVKSQEKRERETEEMYVEVEKPRIL